MSADGSLFFDRQYARIRQMIRDEMAAYKPNLSQAVGDLSPTRYPTPTGNAPGGYTPAAHDHDTGDIVSGTLATARLGSGAASSSTFLRGDSTWATVSGTGTVTSVGITAPAAGITASGGPITTSGAITLALANDLAALEGLSSTGLAARTGTDTWTQRTITGTASRISVANGSGAAGNPTIDIDSGYAGQASITTVGTIGTGTWQGTVINSTYGGTGVNNAGRTLAINTNSGTLAFSAASSTLTIPATGTAALLGTAQTFSADQTLAANLIFSGTGRRITGDMTTSTFADRVSFQSSTTNGTSALGVLPNGTATTASITLFNASDPDNAARLALNATSTAIQFSTNASGSGTQLPMDFLSAGSTKLRLTTNASFLIGKTSGLTGAGDLDVAGVINGDSYISLSEMTAPAAPAANGGRLYLEDNGAGKTRLMIRFSSGASQQIAIQP